MAQEVTKEVWLQADTPTGVQIRYQAEPKRMYQVRQHPDGAKFQPEWADAISVTTALDALNKPGLPWWGMKTGVTGFLTLWGQGMIRPVEGDPKTLAVFGESAWEVADPDTTVRLLSRQKLTVNHVRDKAGDRGHSVHEALERWVSDRTIPVPEFYPETERGYVTALVKFLGDLGEVKSRPQSEIMVGSAKHSFAGRYDLEMVLHGANLVTKVATPAGRKPEVRETFEGRTLLDLKTPKGIYSSHHLQLSGYEGARIECGYPKTTQQLVVRVGDDGNYEVAKNKSTFQEFLAVLAVYRAIARIEGKS